jgi:phage-related holin
MHETFQRVAAVAIKIAAWAVVFTAPVHAFMAATGAIVLIDFVTGIWGALRIGDPLTSSKMSRTVTKTVAYQVAILSAWLFESVFVPELPVVRIAAGFVAATELKSVLENIAKITGLDVWPAILRVLNGHKVNPDSPDGKRKDGGEK